MAHETRRYRVSYTQPARAMVEELAKQTLQDERRTELARVLHEIVELLETQPLEWGDPERHTRLPGGVICHGIREPFLVRFAVYESQCVVVVFKLKLIDARS